MRILAIDASTKSTGWAIFNNTKLETYGCITSSSTDLVKRIYKMVKELKELLINNQIDKIIMEEVRPEQGLQNIKTHKALMYLQAAITFLQHDCFPNIEIKYVYPSEWRRVCGIKTGSGVHRESLKPKDIAFVKQTYNIDTNDDIADAIGIGHAYVHELGGTTSTLAWGSTF